jgi:hypothetical protein
MKSKKGTPSNDGLPKVGRWFRAEGFLLVPNLENVIYPTLGKVKFSISRKRQTQEYKVGKRSHKISRKHAEIRTRRAVRGFREAVKACNDCYGAQPQWSLCDIPVSSDEIVALLQEFTEFLEYTSTEFEWMRGLPILRTELQKHSWKHITYDLIKERVEDQTTLVPAPIHAGLAGTPEQLMNLIEEAENRIPSSVSRLEFLFPNREDLAFACEGVMLEKILRARLDKIPTVGQLAAELATIAVRNPNSTKGQEARDRLQLLVSKGSVLRSSSDNGRPKIQVHATGIRETYKLCYSLIKQIQKVKQFLAKHLNGDKEIEFHLWIFYPWLRDVVGKNVLSFVNGSASDSAAQMTGFMLEISPSKVQQTVYKH